MKLLLLGGPRFLGRAVIEAALHAGHQLTVFNRGTTNPDLFPEVERLRGNRDGDLDALGSRSWDAVIDTCGYVPRVVRQSAQLLAARVEHYVFVSSLSVYASFAEPVDEDSQTAVLESDSEDVQTYYGALKAQCERVVEESFGQRALHVRAGLIVGPHDPTGRFTYWPHRVARGGELLAPGPLTRPVSVIDVRDLASWMVACATQHTSGTMNAVGHFRFCDLFDAAREATSTDPDIIPVTDAFLRDEGVGQWMELPLWIDTGNPDQAHFMDVATARAVAAGLATRPLVDTVRAVLQNARPVPGVGLTIERESELLRRWRSRAS